MVWAIVESTDGELKIALGLTPDDCKAMFEENCYANLSLPVHQNWNGTIIVFGGKDESDVISQMPNLGSVKNYLGPKPGNA